jgi:hypothetical protein
MTNGRWKHPAVHFNRKSPMVTLAPNGVAKHGTSRCSNLSPLGASRGLKVDFFPLDRLAEQSIQSTTSRFFCPDRIRSTRLRRLVTVARQELFSRTPLQPANPDC